MPQSFKIRSGPHIELFNRQRDLDLSHFLSYVPTIVSSVLGLEGARCDRLSIQFLSDSTMRRYHLRFFQDGSSTDCMSFPIDEENGTPIRHLGEIFICPKAAMRYVRKHGLRPEAAFQETSLYIIHGILHLLGYDDMSPSAKSQMRERERRAFSAFEKASNIVWSSLPVECSS